MRTNILPPTFLFVFLVLSIGLHFVLPIKQIVHRSYSYVGAMFIIFGLVLNLWSDALFKKARTPVKPDAMPAELVTSGPFRISRHPMYLGMVSILLGVALVLGSVVAFVFPVLFLIAMEVMFVSLEERNLESAFGDRYLQYRKKVRRWI